MENAYGPKYRKGDVLLIAGYANPAQELEAIETFKTPGKAGRWYYRVKRLNPEYASKFGKYLFVMEYMVTTREEQVAKVFMDESCDEECCCSG